MERYIRLSHNAGQLIEEESGSGNNIRRAGATGMGTEGQLQNKVNLYSVDRSVMALF
jgi:hypothetical protein